MRLLYYLSLAALIFIASLVISMMLKLTGILEIELTSMSEGNVSPPITAKEAKTLVATVFAGLITGLAFILLFVYVPQVLKEREV